mgnify:FL=1
MQDEIWTISPASESGEEDRFTMLQCEFIIWNDAKNAEFKCDGTIEEYAALQENIAMKNIFDYGDGKVGLYR